MRLWARWLPVIAVAMVSVAGCVAQQAPVEAGRPSDTVGAVTVHVSGGIRGVSERHAIQRGNLPDGVTHDEIEDLFVLAGSRAVRAYAGNHLPRGRAACCDRLVYTLTVEHPDGSTTRIVTSDAVDNPAPVDELLTRVLRNR